MGATGEDRVWFRVLEDRNPGARAWIAPAAQEKMSTLEGFQASKVCREWSPGLQRSWGMSCDVLEDPAQF